MGDVTKDMQENRNWFASGGEHYARFRPEYPAELADYLTSLVAERKNALDVGCGTGQLTRLLAEHFSFVQGVDPSASQISHATACSGVAYTCAPAEALPPHPMDYNLITAAQAAHWFRLEDFYREVRRVAAPEAVIALISYGVLQLEGELNERFRCFYYDEIGPFWPAERRLVDEGYRGLSFPFSEITAPPLYIRQEWTLDALAGYISTWSAVAKAREAGQDARLLQFYRELSDLWGPASTRRPVLWPINMRIGRIGQ